MSSGAPQVAELAIRSARALFNRALAEADLSAIGAVLAPDAVLVTGTDSAVLSGRKAQLQTWKSEFSRADRTIYVRRTETVVISTAYSIAFEHGSWEGTSAATGQSLASGSYTAKWRLVGQHWVIEAELFLTLT